jgi:hypothetical protein
VARSRHHVTARSNRSPRWRSRGADSLSASFSTFSSRDKSRDGKSFVIFISQRENKECGAGSHVITPYKGTTKPAAQKDGIQTRRTGCGRSGRMSLLVTMEMTLVARFCERLGAHTVNIGRRVIYLAGS